MERARYFEGQGRGGPYLSGVGYNVLTSFFKREWGSSAWVDKQRMNTIYCRN